MEAYMAAATKSQGPECNQRLKSEDTAQVKTPDFCQTNAHINPMSFIPVYSNKALCHKFHQSSEAQPDSPLERKVLKTYSPPTRPRYLPGGNDTGSRFSRTHLRRRSVGFEDIASLSCYGHNMSNDRRFQSSLHNSNIPQSSTEKNSIYLNSGSIGKSNQSENSSFSSLNYNSQLSLGENANDSLQQPTEKPLQRYKDKSSKRKSSLNRMDFINFASLGNNSDTPQQKNSSSDEGSECKPLLKKPESPIGTAKRKHNAAGSKLENKTNEVTCNSSSQGKVKSNLLPRSSPGSYRYSRPFHWRQSAGIRFSQKLSHSAGEIESLTDLSEVPSKNKVYLSAQEYDDTEIFTNSKSAGAIARNSKLSSRHRNNSSGATPSKSKTCDITSQDDPREESRNNGEHRENFTADDMSPTNLGDQLLSKCDPNESVACLEQNCTASYPEFLNCDDVNNSEILNSTVQLESLEISGDCQYRDIVYLSADENGEGVCSDSERRPSSILRKKSSEEKRELHSILKLPADEKSSKARPSILKHRESSEEKETWQQNDLISILKKSTSEEDSCNSGSDIRPILKLSTDEDSPGSGALRPRPILKKRTSFSDECSYVSFPSGDLKPILKKKTAVSLDDQPRPILKSRRKSEDTRSTLTEVITSRPRAYSADMGVKVSHEGQPAENSEMKSDFCKLADSHNLL